MRHFLVLLPFVYCLVSCVDREAQVQARHNQEILSSPVVPVYVQVARIRSVVDSVEIVGNIVAPLDAEVGSSISGEVITKVYVNEGDRVKENQLLVQQYNEDLIAALRQAEDQVVASRSALDQAILNAKIGPERSTIAIRTAQAELKQAEIQLVRVRTGGRPEERAQARAALASAKSGLELARRQLVRNQVLFQTGAIAKQTLEIQENAYDAAKAQYDQAVQALAIQEKGRREDIINAEQQVKAAREALNNAIAGKKLDPLLQQQVDAARANLKAAIQGRVRAAIDVTNAEVYAPFDGYVFGRPMQPGVVPNVGTTVVRVVSPKGMYFEGNIPETILDNLKVGQSVAVKVEASVDLEVAGRLVAMNPLSDDIGRIFKVRIELENAGPGVKPGMFASGIVEFKKVQRAVTIPVDALMTLGHRNWVFVIEGDIARRINVAPGIRDGNIIQVMGISDGQRVVVQGQNNLRDGTKVLVKKIVRAPVHQVKAGG